MHACQCPCGVLCAMLTSSPNALGRGTPSTRFFQIDFGTLHVWSSSRQFGPLGGVYELCTLPVGLQMLVLLLPFEFEAASASARVLSSRSPLVTLDVCSGSLLEAEVAVGVMPFYDILTFRVVSEVFNEQLTILAVRSSPASFECPRKWALIFAKLQLDHSTNSVKKYVKRRATVHDLLPTMCLHNRTWLRGLPTSSVCECSWADENACHMCVRGLLFVLLTSLCNFHAICLAHCF